MFQLKETTRRRSYSGTVSFVPKLQQLEAVRLGLLLAPTAAYPHIPSTPLLLVLFPSSAGFRGRLGKVGECRQGPGRAPAGVAPQSRVLLRCLPLLSRYLMNYWGGEHNKAKTSSFRIRARPQVQCDWRPGFAASRGHTAAAAAGAGSGRCGGPPGPSPQRRVWLWPTEAGPGKLQQRGTNRLTLSDSFSSWIGQSSPLLAIWLCINSSDTRLNSLK